MPSPPEPILQDTGTLEWRDAVLAWDSTQEDPARSRPDPTPRLPSPVTGELIPDPTATLSYIEHLDARQAPWPEADFRFFTCFRPCVMMTRAGEGTGA